MRLFDDVVEGLDLEVDICFEVAHQRPVDQTQNGFYLTILIDNPNNIRLYTNFW
jgi:hypothetical protein